MKKDAGVGPSFKNMCSIFKRWHPLKILAAIANWKNCKSFKFYRSTFSLKRVSMRIQWMNEKWNFIGLGWSETFLENPILDQNGSQLLKTHFFDVALLWSARVLCNPLSFLSLLHSRTHTHTHSHTNSTHIRKLSHSLSLSVSLAIAHTFGHT